MFDKIDLDDKVAVITGSARGIGREIASRFVQCGARVIISDILDDEGRRTSEELGTRADYVHCDIGEIEQVKSLVDETVRNAGHLDIMVNNAAYNPASKIERKTVDEFTDEVFMDTIHVDINGTYFCSKYAALQMIRQQSGSIISIASIAGVVPIRNQIGHVVGKAGVIRLAQAMALELGCHGIRVNSIAPGSTVTHATQGLFYNDDGSLNEQGKRLLSFVPAGRPGQTEDIADAALFLASDMSSYVTGQNIVVDGGWTCGFTRDF